MLAWRQTAVYLEKVACQAVRIVKNVIYHVHIYDILHTFIVPTEAKQFRPLSTCLRFFLHI